MITLLCSPGSLSCACRSHRVCLVTGGPVRYSIVVPVATTRRTARLRRYGLHLFGIFSESGSAVASCPVVEGMLSGAQILGPPAPGCHRGILEGAPVREADLPGFGSRQSVDLVQMCGG